MNRKRYIQPEWRGRMYRYAPVFLWIGFILYLSSPNGSMTETSRIIGPLLKFFFPAITDETLKFVHAIVRKAAHLTEYAILALLAFRALSLSMVARVRLRMYWLPVVVVALIASIDEFNQSFEGSRTGSAMDVLLDVTGGALMIAFLYVLKRPRKQSSDGSDLSLS
ncbi:VanZ family protein [soil metagenome]